jgi:MFS family permease
MTSQQTLAPAGATAAAPRQWGLLLVLAANMLIDALEVSTQIVAMPSIRTDLDLPLTAAQWTMSGFAVGFGGFMLFGGRLVVLLGRRRVYLAGLLGFAAASLAAGLTSDIRLLIATRVVKGCCAALTAPTGLAIITTAFREGPERSRAVSVYTLFGASGFTAGLLLSGLLTPVDWHWTMAFPAPVVLVLFAFGLRLVPGGAPPAGRPGSDVAGALAFTGWLLALTGAIVSLPGRGWGDPRVAGCFALAAVLLAAFVAVEHATPSPLLVGRMLRNGPLVRSAIGAAALNGSYLGLLFVATFQLQSLPGWSPFRTGLAFLPASLPLAVTALSSGRMVSRFRPPRLIAAGALSTAAGYALYPRGTAPASYATGVLPTMLLVGAGFVLSFAALNTQAVSGVPAAERATAGGTFQTAVQTGAVVMLALVAALCAHRGGAAAPDYGRALALVTAVGGLGLLVALTGLLPPRTRRRAEDGDPQP